MNELSKSKFVEFRRANSRVGWVFASTILVGALLLFQVQPMIGKFILPWFGGSPAVWTTCMLFFQTLLFVGYLYAHVSQRWLRPKGQVTVHLILVMLALAIMPISPNVGWKSASQAAPLARVLGLLLVTVGLPYFVLSATSPLVKLGLVEIVQGVRHIGCMLCPISVRWWDCSRIRL